MRKAHDVEEEQLQKLLDIQNQLSTVETSAATKFQAGIRGRKARRHVSKMRARKQEFDKKEFAATQIQVRLRVFACAHVGSPCDTHGCVLSAHR